MSLTSEFLRANKMAFPDLIDSKFLDECEEAKLISPEERRRIEIFDESSP